MLISNVATKAQEVAVLITFPLSYFVPSTPLRAIFLLSAGHKCLALQMSLRGATAFILPASAWPGSLPKGRSNPQTIGEEIASVPSQ